MQLGKLILKPNHFKRSNILAHPFYLPKVIIQVQTDWSTQQASSLHLRHETTLLSTPLPFGACIITLGKVKMMTKNFAS